MAGSLFGLGAGTPSRFPYPDRPQPGTGVGPSQTNIIRATTVIITGEKGELLVYSPARGAGTLAAAITAGPLTDPYGNQVPNGGFTSFSGWTAGSVAANLSAGQVVFYQRSGGNWVIGPVIDWTPANGFIEFTGAPLRSIDGTESAPTLISTDNWTTVAPASFGAGFAAGTPAPQYAMLPTGASNSNTWAVRGQVLCTGATAANAPMFALPVTFSQSHDFVTPNNLSGATLGARIVRIAANGNVQAQVAGSNTNFVILDGCQATTS